MPKKILIIGMLNSIHMANWIDRLAGMDIVVYLFPSRQYRYLHPKIRKQIENNSKKFKVIQLIPGKYSTYLEYLLDTKWLSGIQFLSRKNRLARLLKTHHFHKIHAIEMQHAGYLLVEANEMSLIQTDVIVTNWGSDIYYFGQIEDHKDKIRSVLKLATHYSAECIRDYDLASNFGYKGKFLPVLPNSTTFSSEHFEFARNYFGKRDQIIMKCYGSTFGLGSMLLQISGEVLKGKSDMNIYCYSVTPDLYETANRLSLLYPSRFRFSTVEIPVSHERILEEFFRSVIYVGASRSDGISTSFLEAISTGAFPIQTSTSCASEWVEKGISAKIVPPNLENLRSAVEDALVRIQELPELTYRNLDIASKHLDFHEIAARTQEFYE